MKEVPARKTEREKKGEMAAGKGGGLGAVEVDEHLRRADAAVEHDPGLEGRRSLDLNFMRAFFGDGD